MSSVFFLHLPHPWIFTLTQEKHHGFPVLLSFTVPYMFQIKEEKWERKTNNYIFFNNSQIALTL